MDNKQNARHQRRQEKRRKRLSFLSLSSTSSESRTGISSRTSTDGLESTTCCSSYTTSSRSYMRGRRKSRNGPSLEKVEDGKAWVSPVIVAPETIEENDHNDESSEEEEVYEGRRRSLYTLPGAFRVSRKCLNDTQMEEIILEDMSIESYSTAKTPPVVVPSASLVQDNITGGTLQESSEGMIVPVARPESNIMYFKKRYVHWCVIGICIVFAALTTGLLFAVGERPRDMKTLHGSSPPSDDDGLLHDRLPQHMPLPAIDLDQGTGEKDSETPYSPRQGISPSADQPTGTDTATVNTRPDLPTASEKPTLLPMVFKPPSAAPNQIDASSEPTLNPTTAPTRSSSWEPYPGPAQASTAIPSMAPTPVESATTSPTTSSSQEGSSIRKPESSSATPVATPIPATASTVNARPGNANGSSNGNANGNGNGNGGNGNGK